MRSEIEKIRIARANGPMLPKMVSSLNTGECSLGPLARTA
jgi:hypothetical protein